MEPEALAFLKRVSKTILLVFTWLAITCVAAIKGDNAFIEGEVTLANILFYVWLVISTIALLVLVKRVWKKPIE